MTEKKDIILEIAKSDSRQLGYVRTLPNVWAGECPNSIWIKTDVKSKGDSLDAIPLIGKYFLEEGLLFRSGEKTPEKSLPLIEWVPIGEFVGVDLPGAGMPGKWPDKISIELVDDDKPRKENVLLVKSQVFVTWVETAAEFLMKDLAFCLASDGRVFVLGNPTPSLPGKAYYTLKNLVLPSGKKLEMESFAFLLGKKWSENPRDLILMTETGIERIPEKGWVKVSRSAVRRSIK